MHIVLLILKIIGIVLAVIFGIILILLLLISFAPVRYVFRIKKQDDIQGKGCFYWLFHTLHAKIIYDNSEVKICIRILGIPIYQSDKPKKDTVEGKKDKKEKKKKAAKREEKEESSSHLSLSKKESDHTPETTQVITTKEKTGLIDRNSREIISKQKSSKNKSSREKISLYKRIKQKIIQTIQSVKEFFSGLKKTIFSLRHRIKKVFTFLKDEKHKNAIRKSKDSIFRILKYLGPQSVKGNIDYGTGDPCSTGMSLGVISIFWAKYGKKIKIRPDFENEIFQVDLTVKGRFELIKLVFVLLKLYRDKDFEAFIEHGKKLKEEF